MSVKLISVKNNLLEKIKLKKWYVETFSGIVDSNVLKSWFKGKSLASVGNSIISKKRINLEVEP